MPFPISLVQCLEIDEDAVPEKNEDRGIMHSEKVNIISITDLG
jgi:hypothetical protein